MHHPVRVLLLLLLAFHPGLAQDTTAIRYAKYITPESLLPYMEVLASDSLEGRETGKPGQKKAAAFIAGHFESAGLIPVSHGGYFQHTSLSARANGSKNFVVNEKQFVFMRDYFYPPGFADSMYVLNRIVLAGNGNADDYMNADAKNAAVLFFDYTPPGMQRSSAVSGEKIRLAKEKEASVAIIITDSLQKIVEEYTYRRPLPISADIPFAFVTRAMAKSFFPEAKAKLFEKAQKKIMRGRNPASIQTETESQLPFVVNTDAIRGENVIALLEGTDKKDEVLVLTAHYDHLGIRDSLIYPGADDDCSGTSAVMEMSRIFSLAAAAGNRPRRSILFMTVSGEEKGLLGSKYYVKHPVVPLQNTIANLNTDMIGRTDAKHDSMEVREYVYIIGSDKLSTALHEVNEKANAAFTKLELDYTYNRPDDPNRFYYRSDHYNFAKHNIPIIFYFNGSHADYHRPGDTVDKIQFDLLAKRTQLIFLTAWELANREERIKVDVVSDMPNRREE
jgi:hypothetical protein